MKMEYQSISPNINMNKLVRDMKDFIKTSKWMGLGSIFIKMVTGRKGFMWIIKSMGIVNIILILIIIANKVFVEMMILMGMVNGL